MSELPWITHYDSPTDPRLGVLYDGSNISANDGDVCISFVTHNLLKNVEKPYCIDIGADECWWAIFCCEQNPATQADAFEPGPIPESLQNTLLTKYPNILLHNKAVSNTPGFLFLSNQGACSNSRTNEGTKVECITLDSFLQNKSKVHLIKIDTEGHELQILENLSKYSEKIEAIIFEFSVHWYADDLYEAIDKTYTCLSNLINTFPFVYVLSRRGPPILEIVELDALLPFIRYCFTEQYQCDLLLIKKSFEFVTQ
jgi:FkbM family methyltransferase